MKILITGANGYIGKKITKLLVKKNKIYSINRTNSEKKYKYLIKNKIKPEIILHLAGSGLINNKKLKKEDYYKKNFLSTLKLINFIHNARLVGSKIIFFSSQAVYSDKNKKKFSEKDKVNPKSYYGKYKYLSEKKLLKIKKNQLLILRIFSVYGIGLKKQLIWDACKKFNNNNPIFFGDGNQIRDFLNITDLLILIKKIIANKSIISNQIYNVGSGKGTKIIKVINTIKKFFEYNENVKFINQHKSGFQNFISSNIKVENDFKWKPKKSLFKELNLYLKWFHKYYSN